MWRGGGEMFGNVWGDAWECVEMSWVAMLECCLRVLLFLFLLSGSVGVLNGSVAVIVVAGAGDV